MEIISKTERVKIERKMEYRNLREKEIARELFSDFIRRQVVVDCWRKQEGKWVIKADPFIDDWSEADYKILIASLRNTVKTGGFVYAVFFDGMMKGFASVEPELFGGDQGYLDLSNIHVSEDVRNRGCGTSLFLAAKEWAKLHGAKKLYISAHSAVESQAFYRKMGCVEAAVHNQAHVEAEPFDCQLECQL